MSNSDSSDPCSKYAYAIAQTGFKGGMIFNDQGDKITVTESMIVNAVNQVHQAWDANHQRKETRLRFIKAA